MPLDVAEIVKKVRRIQIVASRQVDDLLAGEYRSVFRGRGMEFDEVREYSPGDDIRTIEDLQKLPYTYKTEIRESLSAEPPFGKHRAAPMSRRRRRSSQPL